MGNKKVYDPRVYLKLAEESMAERVKQAVEDLRGASTTIYKSLRRQNSGVRSQKKNYTAKTQRAQRKPNNK